MAGKGRGAERGGDTGMDGRPVRVVDGGRGAGLGRGFPLCGITPNSSGRINTLCFSPVEQASKNRDLILGRQCTQH